MKTQIYTPKDYRTSAWSGGTTTEMLIYPPNASYAKRQFDFRISSASIQIPESQFTALGHIQRSLILLEGFVTLQINDQIVPLIPLGSAVFSGSDQVFSRGTGRDLNIMTSPSLSSCHTILHLHPKEEKLLHLTAAFTLLYMVSGVIFADQCTVCAGELILLTGAASGEELRLYTFEPACLIYIEISALDAIKE